MQHLEIDLIRETYLKLQAKPNLSLFGLMQDYIISISPEAHPQEIHSKSHYHSRTSFYVNSSGHQQEPSLNKYILSVVATPSK